MFSTPFTFCSSGVATDCSTLTASAPVYVPVTWISGGVISGYCAIGSRWYATMPTSVITIDSTIATMGRLMKNLAMARPYGVFFVVSAGGAPGGAAPGAAG